MICASIVGGRYRPLSTSGAPSFVGSAVSLPTPFPLTPLGGYLVLRLAQNGVRPVRNWANNEPRKGLVTPPPPRWIFGVVDLLWFAGLVEAGLTCSFPL